MTRRGLRDSAFKIIFESLLRDDSVEELYEVAEEADEITVNNEVKKIVEGVISHSDELDKIISKYSKTRTLSRISKLNIAILRIGLYEAIYDDRTPVNVAINEAVLLSKAYTFKEDTSFINGILGAFSRDIQSGESSNG